MQDLSKFNAVKDALSQVVAESTENNGTMNVTLMAHYWENEYAFDENHSKLRTDIAKALLTGKIDEVKPLQDKLSLLPKPKVIMVFKLLDPIRTLKGTKLVWDGDKSFSPVMNNVDKLYVSEDAVKLGLLEYEETTDVAPDYQGKDSVIIKLHLKKGIIDVKEGIKSRQGKVVRAPRAYVTAISFKAMQVAGKVMWNETEIKRKMYGYEEN